MKKVLIVAIFSILIALGFNHFVMAMFIDTGGGISISSSSPQGSSGKWNPPSGTPNNNNNSYPDLLPLNGDIRPYYDVGNSIAYKQNAQINLYANVGDLLLITVNNAGAGCQTAPPAGGAAGGPDYNDDGSSNGPTTQFWIQGPNGPVTAKQTRTGADGCGSTVTFSYVMTAADSYVIRDANGVATPYSSASVYVNLMALVPAQTATGENSFWISSSINQIGTANAITGYGYRDKDVSLSNHWTTQIIFGVLESCQYRDPSISSGIAYTDMDVNKYNDPNIKLEIQRRLWGAPGNDWENWTGQISPGQSGSINRTFEAKYKYRLIAKNMGARNTIFLQLGAGLSQLAGRDKVDDSDCGSVTCTATPSAQSVQQNSTGTIKIVGSSPQPWKSTYYVKRTGPSYKTINSSSQTFTDSVIYVSTYGAPPVTVPYVYTIWDSATNKQVSGGNCTAQVTWIATGSGAVTCSATTANPNPSIGGSTNIDIILTNNSPNPITGFQLRQKPSDTAGTGQTWPVGSGFGNFTTGQSAPHTFTVVRGTATVVTFSYILFDGPNGGNVPASGIKNPLCAISITWGSPPNAGNMAIGCSQTTIPAMTSTATYQHAVVTVTTPPSYITAAAPATWPSYLPGGPPAAAPLTIINGTINVNIWSYQPPPVTTTTYVTLPASVIPIQIRFDDGNVYNTTIPGNPTGLYSIDTFNAMGFLLPHQAYTATLFAQISGDLGSEQGGPYGNPWTQIGQPQALPQCLVAHADACVGGNSPAAVPGQAVQSTYQITITNNTNRNFNSGFGYNILAHPDGAGLVANGNMSQDVGIPANQQSTMVATFSFISNYQGSYWVEFRFGGTRLDSLPDQGWPGTCGSGSDSVPPVTITPQVTPYFQVWNSDTSAGGGFYNPSNTSCAGSADPPYIWPGMAGGDQNSGGIRAFGSSTLGSNTDFGAVAMGLIPGSGGGPIGFFSRNNAYYANTNLPSGLGGYLNSNSSWHCVEDFFTSTQVNPGSAPALSDLQTDINNCPIDATTNSARCQFQSTGAFIGGDVVVPAAHQITVYVDGDVTINGNITYPKVFDPATQSNVPYFALIVRGNITLTNNVTQLDGLYVAQPTSGGGGVFSTCADMCNRQLVVNGAVIAQHVQLLRAHGATLLIADPNGIGTNPAEIFNYVPSMVLGMPMFNPQPVAPEGLYSLPPVF